MTASTDIISTPMPVILVAPDTNMPYRTAAASNTNATPGTDATMATSVQGVTGGKPVSTVASNTGAASDQIQGAAAQNTATATNPVDTSGIYLATPGTITTGNRATLTLGPKGALRVDLATINGSGSDGRSNAMVGYVTDRDGPGTSVLLATANYVFNPSNTTWDRQKKPGLVYRLLSSAATTNGALIRAGTTDVFRITGNNTVASKRYLKLYNKATAPTVGTDTPVATMVLLASAGFDFSIPPGLSAFPLGLGIAITGAAADADTTAIALGDIECLNLMYG